MWLEHIAAHWNPRKSCKDIVNYNEVTALGGRFDTLSTHCLRHDPLRACTAAAVRCDTLVPLILVMILLVLAERGPVGLCRSPAVGPMLVVRRRCCGNMSIETEAISAVREALPACYGLCGYMLSVVHAPLCTYSCVQVHRHHNVWCARQHH